MNANDIWSGNVYAYMEAKPKAVDAPKGAAKVRAIRVVKRLEYGKQRETAYVISEILDGGDSYSLSRQVGTQVELRARDFIDFWDDYQHRREELDKEAKERQERVEKARQEREAEEKRRREEAAEEKRELINQFSLKTGIPEGWIVIDYSIIGVRNTQEFRNWLMEDTVVVRDS